VDRLSRKELKTDKFVEETGHIFEFLTDHPEQLKIYGGIALAVILLAGGIYFYRSHQATAREEALAQAMRIDNGVVNNTPVPPNLTFKTQQEKDAARTKAFTELATKYHGSREGAIGGIYLASTAADNGDLASAEKQYRDVVDSAPSDFASVATVSLAQILYSEGKHDEAEKLLRDLIKNPTVLVSKEQATIELAALIAKSKPAEARALLDPLKMGRNAVSRQAIQMLGQLPQNN
jgi:predicted negative regulator of RcsB-dependent stress response